jgi:hypothetical protein
VMLMRCRYWNVERGGEYGYAARRREEHVDGSLESRLELCLDITYTPRQVTWMTHRDRFDNLKIHFESLNMVMPQDKSEDCLYIFFIFFNDAPIVDPDPYPSSSKSSKRSKGQRPT